MSTVERRQVIAAGGPGVDRGGASQRSPAWNWNAELADPERTELDGLRRHVADLQAQTAQLREHADTATKTAQHLRAALTRLANATPRQRRRVTADLRASGLLP